MASRHQGIMASWRGSDDEILIDIITKPTVQGGQGAE